MSTLEWQESWSVGNDGLDNDHKRLIQIIQNVGEYRTRAFDLGQLVYELEDYTKYHFAREEKMMEAANIQGLDAHKEKHRAFIEWLTSVRHAFTLSHESRDLMLDSVEEYLQEWLTNHILKTDMSYKGQL